MIYISGHYFLQAPILRFHQKKYGNNSTDNDGVETIKVTTVSQCQHFDKEHKRNGYKKKKGSDSRISSVHVSLNVSKPW